MNEFQVHILSAEQAAAETAALYEVLRACVAKGASVGFISLDPIPMQHFWQGVIASLVSGERRLIVARQQGRSLLVLDTRSGDIAGQIYLSEGWQIAGHIPQYARSTEGTMDATTIMYKWLG